MTKRGFNAIYMKKSDSNNRKMKASNLLKNPESYPGIATLRRHHLRLQLWCYSKDGNDRSWSLYVEGEGFRLRRIQIVPVPDQRAESAEPMMRADDVLMTTPEVDTILSDLESIRVPPFLKNFSTDLIGTGYGIALGPTSQSSCCKWWGTAPREWKDLAQWYNETVSTFEKLYESRNL